MTRKGSAPSQMSMGVPEPLGASYDGRGVNFAVASSSAEAIFVSLFDAADCETACLRLPGRTGHVFHGALAGLGPGTRYGLRAHGRFDPASGHRFNAAKLLVDPFATRLDRSFKLDASLFDSRLQESAADDIDSARFVPKAVVEAPPVFQLPRRPRTGWRDLVIYEMHVRGFTMRHPDIPDSLRGTFAGLAHEASTGYLKHLGVSAVELLPIAAWIDERHLPSLGLSNYWGYNPIAMLAPDPRLAPGGWAEIAEAVDALHAAGIVVILDIVLNHTGESDEFGPVLSMRGLDNSGFYRLRRGDLARYNNESGCGNVPALERPFAMRLALEALRTAVMRAGVDGFRYDLATVLGRREEGFDPDHPLLAAITQDPWLKDLIHIAEPWDLGPGGYQLGAFPATWGEWNDQSRDTLRRFWRGNPGTIGALATRLAGSADIFAPRHRPLSRSVNFVTAHDGFTLADLVAFEGKRNTANGEENHDGTNENLSWNCGIDGPVNDPAVLARRAGDVRALLATLFAMRGTPMLCAGDELGRSQGGNNNAYAQDNTLTWIDWASADVSLIEFVARLIRLRRTHGAFNAEAPLTGAPLDATGVPDVEWLTFHGRPFTPDDWNDHNSRALAAIFYDPGDSVGGFAPNRAAVLINGGEEEAAAVLPEPGKDRVWALEIDSARPDCLPHHLEANRYVLAGRSVAILVERPSPLPRRQSPATGRVLDALAMAAGIAPHWFDVNGQRHDVPDATKRALLASLGLPSSSAGEARASLAVLAQDRELRPLPIAVTIRQSDALVIRLGGHLAENPLRIGLTLSLEDGPEHQIEIAASDGERREITAVDGRKTVVRHILLPALPLGRHRIWAQEAPECVSHLAIVPDTVFLPDFLQSDARFFGIAAQLYTLRREPFEGLGDQGIGDFTTLRVLAKETSAAGAITAGINPLHALFASNPGRASPYHPSDRRFLDPLAIDVFDLPEPLLTEAVRAAIEHAGPEAARLSAVPIINHMAVAGLKNALFNTVHAAFRELSQNRPGDRLVENHAGFLRAGGEPLRLFAIFSAIEASPGVSLGHFPGPLKSPSSPGVAAFAAVHEEAVSRAIFLQWLADWQFAKAASTARDCGLKLGYYRDLAVGCAPDGAEAWAQAGLLMPGVSIGAPPDPLGPNGQVWGLPPYDPQALKRDGFAAFGQLLAANMKHAGLLRIDHVLGLKRLFLVPEGAEGWEGAYLAYPFNDLLGQLTLESQRAQTAIVGEDLGTVPEGLRDELAAAHVLSYRVMCFERDGKAFVPPNRYPRLAAACVATHDLPPLAGWWEGEDLAEALKLGLLASKEEVLAARASEKSALTAAVSELGFLPPASDLDGPLTEAAAASVHGFVAASNAVLALVQADDLAMEKVAVNLPGTDKERPNWRRKIRLPVQALFSLSSAKMILEYVRHYRNQPVD